MKTEGTIGRSAFFFQDRKGPLDRFASAASRGESRAAPAEL
jgi:hypothetical protein